jgi:hypothetical protein
MQTRQKNLPNSGSYSVVKFLYLVIRDHFLVIRGGLMRIFFLAVAIRNEVSEQHLSTLDLVEKPACLIQV